MNEDQNEQPEIVTEELDEPGALSMKQERALQALLSHPTRKEAARAAEISDATLWRYMQDKEFSRRFSEASREASGHAFTRLQNLSGDAVGVLEELMKKGDAPAPARIRAACAVLDYTLRAREIEDLRARIKSLEEVDQNRRDQEIIRHGLAHTRRRHDYRKEH